MTKEEEKNSLKEELRKLLAEAAKKEGSRKKALEAMGIKRKTMDDVLYGKRSEKTMLKYTLAMKKFLGGDKDGKGNAACIAEITTEYGGETSARGVPFVLTEKSFNPTAGKPSKILLELAVKNIQALRLLLIYFSQVKDDVDREEIRKALGPEVEELFLALKSFSQAFPNNILHLLDAQREHWEALAKEKIKETGKR